MRSTLDLELAQLRKELSSSTPAESLASRAAALMSAHPDPEARILLLQALAPHVGSSPSLTAIVLEALADEGRHDANRGDFYGARYDVGVGEIAAGIVASLGAAAVPPLIEMYRRRATARRSVLLALQQIRSPTAVRFLLEVLRAADEGLGEEAAHALRATRLDDASVSEITGELDHPEWWRRRRAALACPPEGFVRRLDVVLELIGTEPPTLREILVNRVVSGPGRGALVDRIERALAERDPNRANYLRALASGWSSGFLEAHRARVEALVRQAEQDPEMAAALQEVGRRLPRPRRD